VKESATEAREVREGFVDLVADAYLVAEPCDGKPLSEYPFEGPDFLSLDLGEGATITKAQDVAAFLNANVRCLAITRFGDAQDATRDVRNSRRANSIEADRFAMVVTMLKEKIEAGDAAGIKEALIAVQSVSVDLLDEWAKALQLSNKILEKFDDGDD
jgi:hypothetical protein